MSLAAVHLQPLWSIAAAVLIGAWLVWYWTRLGRADVPASRRKIRRLSLGLMLLSLPMFVRALSFLDPKTQQREYVIAWSVAFAMVLLVMITAALDVANTLRLMHRQAHDEMRKAAGELGQAIKLHQQARRIVPGPRHTKNGEAKS